MNFNKQIELVITMIILKMVYDVQFQRIKTVYLSNLVKYPYKPFPLITEYYSDGLDNQLKSYNR